MSWYDKYMQVYGKSYDEIACKNIVAQVRLNLARLQSKQPLVTVAIIAYNEEKHLLACLWALSELKTRYPIEIIGVDNDSKDKTGEIFRASGIPYYTEFQHSCGYARLCGLSHAQGKYHVNIDADTLYPPKYVDRMIAVMECSQDVVGICGTWGYFPDKNHSRIAIWLYEFFRNCYLKIQALNHPELSVRGLVFAYRVEEARKVGIRVHIIRGEDGALAFGLRKYGKIAFLCDNEVRAITGYGTVGDCSMWKSFWIRVVQASKGFKHLFTPAKEYKDRDYNLIGKNKQ